jgi:hypothetical protein
MSSVTIAGMPILLDVDRNIQRMIDHKLRSFVWQSIQSATDFPQNLPFIFKDYNRDVLTLPYGEVPSPRINEFICPTGMSRFGRGMFLLDSDALDQIPGPESSFNIVFTNEDNSTVDIEVHGLRPIAVHGTDLWILPVVDSRFGVRNNYEQWYKPTETWQENIQRVHDFADIDVRFGYPDKNLILPLGNVLDTHNRAILTDAVAISCGARTLGGKGIDNLLIQSSQSAKNRLTEIVESPNVMFGGIVGDLVPPGKITVIGPEAYDYVDQKKWLWETNESNDDITSKTLVLSTFRKSFKYPAYPHFGNVQAFNRFVLAISSAFDAWRHPYGILTAAGFHDWRDCACLDYTSIYISGTDSATTSAMTQPPDFFMRVNLSQWNDSYVHTPAGSSWLLKTGESGISKAESDYFGELNLGVGECEILELKSNLYTGTEAVLRAKTQSGSNTEFITAYNSQFNPIPGGQVIHADTIDFKAVAVVPKSNNAIKFITTTEMYNSAATAYLHGGDPTETFVVHDIQNHWPEVQVGAVGWAQFRLDRYEILNVSLPIDRVMITFDKCIKGTDETYTAVIRLTDVPGLTSSFPHVDLPSEWTALAPSPGSFRFEFINPERLTSIEGGRGELVRYPKHKKLSDNLNIIPHLNRVSLEYEWRLVAVTKPYAKSGFFVKNSDLWDMIKPIDGYDPMQCDGGASGDGARPSVMCSTLGNCDCIKDGHKAYGVYSIEDNHYDIISTASALLGEPLTKDLHVGDMSFDKTTLKYKKQSMRVFTCGSEPQDGTATIPTTPCLPTDSGGQPLIDNSQSSGGT